MNRCDNPGSSVASRYMQLVIIDSGNKGAGAARNSGIETACGKYLAFPDSNSWLEPNMLSIAYTAVENDKADITIFHDNQTGKTTPYTYFLRFDRLPQHRPFAVMGMECSAFRSLMGCAWDKLCKRSFVLNNDLRFRKHDMYFTFISIYKATRITICKEHLYNRRRNVISTLSDAKDLSWKCFYRAFLELRRELQEMGEREKYQSDFTDYALNSCLWNLNTLNESAGMKLYDKLKTE